MQRGFIQIPILIAIIISTAVVVGGGGYFVAKEIYKPQPPDQIDNALETQSPVQIITTGEVSVEKDTETSANTKPQANVSEIAVPIPQPTTSIPSETIPTPQADSYLKVAQCQAEAQTRKSYFLDIANKTKLAAVEKIQQDFETERKRIMSSENDGTGISRLQEAKTVAERKIAEVKKLDPSIEIEAQKSYDTTLTECLNR